MHSRQPLLAAGMCVAALTVAAGRATADQPPDYPLPQQPCREAAQAGPLGRGQAVFPCDFPDPMVLRVARRYYAYGSTTVWQGAGRAFPVLSSTDLRHWRHAGDAFRHWPRWANGDLWAPSVLRARGRYFLFYTGRRSRDRVHCLAVATAGRPAGPYRDRGVIACRDRTGSGYIDPAPLTYRGRTYLLFSVDHPLHSISVLPLSRGLLSARGSRRTLLRVTRPWQMGLLSQTIEAPWAVRRGKRFYLFYSAGSWLRDYRMGYAVADRPLGPYRDKSRGPILVGRPALPSPGGGSLFTTGRGALWLAFHAWTGDYGGGIRTLRMAPVNWRGGAPWPRLASRDRSPQR